MLENILQYILATFVIFVPIIAISAIFIFFGISRIRNLKQKNTTKAKWSLFWARFFVYDAIFSCALFVISLIIDALSADERFSQIMSNFLFMFSTLLSIILLIIVTIRDSRRNSSLEVNKEI